MDAEELAERLVGSGKPISGERLQKFARHLKSRAHLAETLSYLRPDEASEVLSNIEPFIRKLV
jgi:hypothetical protein